MRVFQILVLTFINLLPRRRRTQFNLIQVFLELEFRVFHTRICCPIQLQTSLRVYLRLARNIIFICSIYWERFTDPRVLHVVYYSLTFYTSLHNTFNFVKSIVRNYLLPINLLIPSIPELINRPDFYFSYELFYEESEGESNILEDMQNLINNNDFDTYSIPPLICTEYKIRITQYSYPLMCIEYLVPI